MMIGAALRVEIERYAVEMRRSNPLFTKARDGRLTADCIARYLTSIHHLVRYTPIYLARANERALELRDEPLAAHYREKRGEEMGHDAWAERDLQRVSLHARRGVSREVMPAIHDLLDYLGRVIDDDPVLYLAYILFSEQLVVILGPEWLTLLEERCGIPRSSMTIIANHAELDKEHVEHALEEIDDLVGDPRKLPRMREVLRQSIALFDQFCVEVTGRESDAASEHEREVAKHVSAA